ncbi:hypothetical protein BH11ACT7_BH11ACT7_33230 [soil metagenome]
MLIRVSAPALAAAVLAIAGSSPATAAPVDYGALPVNPNVITDSSAYAPAPLVQNPGGQPGVEAAFTHRDSTRTITETILVLPDPSAAVAATERNRSELGTVVINQKTQPLEVGQGGTLVSGTSPDGTEAVSVLLFTQGDAAAQIEFAGPLADPVPVELVSDLGRQQATTITQQLGT